MMTHAPNIGGVVASNQYQKRREINHNSIGELIQNKTGFQTAGIPGAKDRSASHAIVIMDDITFDSTQSHAMKVCKVLTKTYKFYINSLLLCNNSVTSIGNTQLSLYIWLIKEKSYSHYHHIQLYSIFNCIHTSSFFLWVLFT
jgi:hypothetical protein